MRLHSRGKWIFPIFCFQYQLKNRIWFKKWFLPSSNYCMLLLLGLYTEFLLSWLNPCYKINFEINQVFLIQLSHNYQVITQAIMIVTAGWKACHRCCSAGLWRMEVCGLWLWGVTSAATSWLPLTLQPSEDCTAAQRGQSWFTQLVLWYLHTAYLHKIFMYVCVQSVASVWEQTEHAAAALPRHDSERPRASGRCSHCWTDQLAGK